MARPQIQGIDRPPSDALQEMIALCHDAAEHSLRAAQVTREESFTTFFAAAGASYRETISRLEALLKKRESQSAQTGRVADTTDRLLTLASPVASQEPTKVVVEQYIKAVSPVLIGLAAACAEGTLTKSEREIALRRSVLHQRQRKHLEEMLEELT